jgi:nucleoid-associated protein YgaU
MGRSARVAAVVVIAAATAVCGVVLLARATSAAVSATERTRSAGAALDAWLGTVAAGVLGLMLLWWALASLACVLAAVRRPSRLTRRLAGTLPRPARALVTAAIGAAVIAGATGPAALAQAARAGTVAAVDPGWPAAAAERSTEPEAPSVDTASATSPAVDPAWAPVRPSAPAVQALPPPGLVVEQPRATLSTVEQVAVHRGDTLWDICARHLPSDATDAEIAAEWPRWYDANRAVIGPDPDHLEPGQLLSPPSAAGTA